MTLEALRGENLLAGPAATETELMQDLLRHDGSVRLERIVSPPGFSSPRGLWYDQAWDEWVLVLRGSARLGLDGAEPVALAQGDHVLIPAGTKHRVEWTDPGADTVWLALHLLQAHPGPGP
ncbi:cupin domain-containing protein [Candidatus Fermentibacterales bacterium]|nr:cupin domain-containing protein [Candidatus Fermentibacterales bacterium]